MTKKTERRHNREVADNTNDREMTEKKDNNREERG